MILQPDPTIGIRVKELASELKIAWMPGVSPIMDEKGSLLQPMVTLGTKYQADLANNWLFDNYKKYWGSADIDASKLGYICLTITSNPILKTVYEYSNQGFKEKFPAAAEKRLRRTDCTQSDEPRQCRRGLQYCLRNHGGPPGDHRAGLSPRSSRTTPRAPPVPPEPSKSKTRCSSAPTAPTSSFPCSRRTASDKAWVAGIYYAQDIFCEPLVCGIIAMLDGRATPETLYPEWKGPRREIRQHPLRHTCRYEGYIPGVSR